MARREISILGFSFLDAMTCGFGAVVLLFMIINASVDLRATQLTSDLRAEADRLEEEVLDGHENLVELRNSLREIEDENVLAQARVSPAACSRPSRRCGRSWPPTTS
jgi:hypothetical protein